MARLKKLNRINQFDFKKNICHIQSLAAPRMTNLYNRRKNFLFQRIYHFGSRLPIE